MVTYVLWKGTLVCPFSYHISALEILIAVFYFARDICMDICGGARALKLVFLIIQEHFRD